MEYNQYNKYKMYKPTNDYVFKRIFGKRGNEDITRDFIEKTTGIKYETIKLDDTPILESDLIGNKMGVLDVRVIANKKNNIDLEMQVAQNDYIADRILWYWAKMYSTSINSGESYDSTKKTKCILIADFKLKQLTEIPEFRTRWKIREEKYTNIVLTDKLEIVIIELSKLENNSKEDKELQYWCEFIKNPEKVSNSIMEKNENIKKAKEELEKINADEKERRLAELREKAILDELAIKKTGYEEGKEAGIKEGMKAGKEAGIKEGIRSGEKAKQIEIAKKMIEKNTDIKFISEVTNLTMEEIKALKSKN